MSEVVQQYTEEDLKPLENSEQYDLDSEINEKLTDLPDTQQSQESQSEQNMAAAQLALEAKLGSFNEQDKPPETSQAIIGPDGRIYNIKSLTRDEGIKRKTSDGKEIDFLADKNDQDVELFKGAETFIEELTSNGYVADVNELKPEQEGVISFIESDRIVDGYRIIQYETRIYEATPKDKIIEDDTSISVNTEDTDLNVALDSGESGVTKKEDLEVEVKAQEYVNNRTLGSEEATEGNQSTAEQDDVVNEKAIDSVLSNESVRLNQEFMSTSEGFSYEHNTVFEFIDESEDVIDGNNEHEDHEFQDRVEVTSIDASVGSNEGTETPFVFFDTHEVGELQRGEVSDVVDVVDTQTGKHEVQISDEENVDATNTAHSPAPAIGSLEPIKSGTKEVFVQDISGGKENLNVEITAPEVSDSSDDLQLSSNSAEHDRSSADGNEFDHESSFQEIVGEKQDASETAFVLNTEPEGSRAEVLFESKQESSDTKAASTVSSESSFQQEIAGEKQVQEAAGEKQEVTASDTETAAVRAEGSFQQPPEKSNTDPERFSDTDGVHENATLEKKTMSVLETSVDVPHVESFATENDVRSIDTELNVEANNETLQVVAESVFERNEEQVRENNSPDKGKTIVEAAQKDMQERVTDERNEAASKDSEGRREASEDLIAPSNENGTTTEAQSPDIKSPELSRQALENSSVREQTTTSSNNEKETTWQYIETNMREVVSSPAVEAQNLLWGEQSIKELVPPKIASEIDKAQTALEKDEPGTVRVVRSNNNGETEVLVLGKNEDNTVSVGFYEPKVGPHDDSGMASVETSPFVDNPVTVSSSPRKPSVTGRESLVLQIPDEELDTFVTSDKRLENAEYQRSSGIFKTNQETRRRYIPSPESPGLGGTRGGQLFIDTDTDTDNEPTRNVSTERETDSLLMKT